MGLRAPQQRGMMRTHGGWAQCQLIESSFYQD
jgi:hypothetical protein